MLQKLDLVLGSRRSDHDASADALKAYILGATSMAVSRTIAGYAMATTAFSGARWLSGDQEVRYRNEKETRDYTDCKNLTFKMDGFCIMGSDELEDRTELT